MTTAFSQTSVDQVVHEIASPLLTVRNGQQEYASGTAFIVGKGFAITAYHVLADFVEKYEGVRDVESHLNITFQMLMFITADKGRKQIPLKVLRAWSSPPLDLAVLAFGIPPQADNHRWLLPRLSLLPPPVGTPVAGFGFADSDIQALETPNTFSLEVHPRTSTGTVEELHHEIRDRVRLPFPCFRTNARFDGGMSGGPIFNDKGHVCGVICSSLPPDVQGAPHTSYACSLWPIVGILVDAAPGNAASGEYYPVMNLFTQNALHAADLDQVSLEHGQNGERQPRVFYNAATWEKGSGV